MLIKPYSVWIPGNSLITPQEGSNWAVATPAESVNDSLQPSLSVRSFPDNAETGAGILVYIPEDINTVRLLLPIRPASAPADACVVAYKLYGRPLPVTAEWSSFVLPKINMLAGATEYTVQHEQFNLSYLLPTLVRGAFNLLELTRVTPQEGANLVGPALLLGFGLNLL